MLRDKAEKTEPADRPYPIDDPAAQSVSAGEQPVPYPILKRLTDKLVALAILVVLSPLLALVLVGMGANMLFSRGDRGRWMYRERRISKGKEVAVLKFRVLREDVLAHMNDNGPEHTRVYERELANLTWAGRHLIKKWYLDEVPQLINILKGDMSLVGPRPWPLPLVEDQAERGITYRNLILAGWTGPAQVVKANTTLRETERLDQEYVAACRGKTAWSLWRYDLGILYQTLKITLRSEGLRF